MRSRKKETRYSNVTLNSFVIYICLLAIALPCSADDFERRLKLLYEQYRSVPSIRFEADTTLLFKTDQKRKPMFISYQYWGKGEKYRANLSYTNEENTKSNEMINIAYNGKRFQRLDLKDSILNYCREDRSITPALTPNPALYPVRFVRPYVSQADVGGMHLRFKDLYNKELWNEALTNARVIQGGGAGRPMVVEFLMKGSYDVCYRVHFGQDPDYMPIQITEFSEKGKSIVKIEEYYSIELNGKKTYWPKLVKNEIIVAEGGGAYGASVETTLKSLGLGKEFPPGIFDLDFTRADLVWDDDLELAVKHPRGYVGKPDFDIIDNTMNAKFAFENTTELQQNKMGALANLDSDKTGSVLNTEDMQDNSTLPIASKQYKPNYFWPIAILLFSGVTMFYLWYHNHAVKRELKTNGSDKNICK